jgi:hypothetical protein
MKVALIDSTIKTTFAAALKEDVHPIFIKGDDTFPSLLQKIRDLQQPIENVVIAQHSAPFLRIGAEIIRFHDETTWTGLKQFLIDLKSLGVVTVDFLACLLYGQSGVPQMFAHLEAETGLNLRASSDLTGNAEIGGNWILESDMIDIQDLYFTQAISEFKDVLYTLTNTSMYAANKIIKDVSGNFIYLHKDISGRPINPPSDLSGYNLKYPAGKVVAWGTDGANSSGVSGELLSGVVAIYSTDKAFAALKNNGKVVTWGSSLDGANSSGVSGELLSGVVAIYSNRYAFAALKNNGKVVTWNSVLYGGDSSTVANDLLNNVVVVYSTHNAFAALKNTGKVVTWGRSEDGGDSLSVSGELLSGVISIYSTSNAFAALKDDGKVVTWGADGGNSSGVSGELLSGVVAIYSTQTAFAALKNNGKVVTWGANGGNSSGVSGELLSGVVSIYSTSNAFAALKNTGKVVTWGVNGGNSFGVSGELLSGVVAIYATDLAFAALKDTGKVVTWGEGAFGGNSSGVSGELLSGVVSIYSTSGAFAALKNNGKVVTWGETSSGANSSGVSGELLSGVVSIYSTYIAFAALKNNGKVVTWGNPLYGANSSGVSGELLSGVVAIYSSNNSFAVIKPTVPVTIDDYYYPTGASKMLIPITAPAPVLTVDAVANSPTQVTVTFSDPTGDLNIVQYDIFVLPAGSSQPVSSTRPDVIVYVGSPLEAIFTGLFSTSSYDFWVFARNNLGNILVRGVDSVTTLAPETPTYVPCFTAGTRIRTPTGEKLVENIDSGDLVLTADGRSVPVTLFITHVQKTNKFNAPYTIPAKTFNSSQKHAITVSPLHAIQSSKGVWQIPEFSKLWYPNITQSAMGSSIIYYHLECPNFLTDNLVANGIIVESFGARVVNLNKSLYVFNKKVCGFIRNESANKTISK